MENIIRVRVWDEKKELMYYDLPLHLLIRFYNRLNHLNDIFRLPGYIFMRYTGFLDHKKRRIFEYDIIEYQDIFYIIKWSKSYGSFKAEEVIGFDAMPLYKCQGESGCEVIGNKYQPPKCLSIEV